MRLLYSWELSREKTFVDFEVLWLVAKVFSVKFGGMASFSGISEQSTKVFSAKIHQFAKVFFCKKFSAIRYVGMHLVLQLVAEQT